MEQIILDCFYFNLVWDQRMKDHDCISPILVNFSLCLYPNQLTLFTFSILLHFHTLDKKEDRNKQENIKIRVEMEVPEVQEQNEGKWNSLLQWV